MDGKATRHTKPIGYMERRGDCIIKKVLPYGMKYKVFRGMCFWRFATLRKAREFAFSCINKQLGYGSAL